MAYHPGNSPLAKPPAIPSLIEDTPALREEVYRNGVVVQNLKDDNGGPNGIAVIWADKYYGLVPAGVMLASIGFLFFAFLFGLMALIMINSGGNHGDSSAVRSLAWLPGLLALGIIGALFRFWNKSANARLYDTLRCLAILSDGGLRIPFGIPNGEDRRRLNTKYEDVTGIEISPEREWGGYSGSDKYYVLLQTQSGRPVFIGLSDRGKAQLQPVVVALHNAWEKMRPFVMAHRAIESGQPIILDRE